MFVTTTIAVVYWTVFVQGITIKPLVKFLNVKTANEKVGHFQRLQMIAHCSKDAPFPGFIVNLLLNYITIQDPTMNERIAGRFMDHVVAGMEGILGELGNLRSVTWRKQWLGIQMINS